MSLLRASFILIILLIVSPYSTADVGPAKVKNTSKIIDKLNKRLDVLKKTSEEKFKSDYSYYSTYNKEMSDLWNKIIVKSLDNNGYQGFLVIDKNKYLIRDLIKYSRNDELDLFINNGVFNVKSNMLSKDEIKRVNELLNSFAFNYIFEIETPYQYEIIKSYINKNKSILSKIEEIKKDYNLVEKNVYIINDNKQPPFTDTFGNLYIHEDDLTAISSHDALVAIMFHEAAHLHEKIFRLGYSLGRDYTEYSVAVTDGYGYAAANDFDDSEDKKILNKNKEDIKRDLLEYAAGIASGKKDKKNYLYSIDILREPDIYDYNSVVDYLEDEQENKKEASLILNDKDTLSKYVDRVYDLIDFIYVQSQAYESSSDYSDSVEAHMDFLAFSLLERKDIFNFVKYMSSDFVGFNRYKKPFICIVENPTNSYCLQLNLNKFIKKYYLTDFYLKGNEILRYFRPFYNFTNDCIVGELDICDFEKILSNYEDPRSGYRNLSYKYKDTFFSIYK